MNLKIVTTGGTIDKIYFDSASAYEIGDPQIGEILRAFNVALDYEIQPLMRKDSLDMTDAERSAIRDAIAASHQRRIVVTHGTDTMVETAKVLQPLRDKTIVLTGALNPAKFLGSDATFNIGCAVAAVQTLPPGVYIAMNGRIWDPDSVRKNREKNRFEPLD